ncbi:unnamed protein product [Hapterophycus canaliculatus]
MRARTHLSSSQKERISLTRDIALYALTSYSTRRDVDVSFTLGSQALRLPDSRGLVANFHFGECVRQSYDAVVVLADAEYPQICAFLAITEYISAARTIGWDLASGHLFLAVSSNGGRGDV